MNNQKRKPFLRTKKAAILGLLAVALLSFGTTWAYYYNNSIELSNPLSTTHSGAAMVEEFDPGSSFLPGETAAKVVKFTNTGDMDLLLRVEVPPEEGWYFGGKKDDTNLSTEYVIKNWSAYWATLPAGESFTTDTDDDYLSATYDDTDNEWTEVYTVTDSAGNTRRYRYYKKVLYKKGTENDAGEAIDTTNPVLESITLSPEVSNDRHSADYSNRTYKLTFNAEAIPVEGGDVQSGALSEWGMTAEVDEDEVTWSEPSS